MTASPVAMNLSSLDDRPPGIRRIFIDCTATRTRDTNSGIQRVVRNVVNHAVSIGSELGVECRGVAFQCGTGFVPVDGLPSPSVDGPLPNGGGLARPRRFRSKLKDWLDTLHLLGAARRIRQLPYHAKSLVLLPVRRKFRRGIQLGRGDVLLLIDSSWDLGPPWQDVCLAQARGAIVGLVLHDLIPILHPDLVAPHMPRVFGEWWNNVRNIADFVIGVSRSVVDDITVVDRSRPPPRRPAPLLRTACFRNGAGLEGADGGGPVRNNFTSVFGRPSGRPTYLMVGVVAPRKNHALALDAFDRLWAANADMNLAIAGRYGGSCAAVAERIRRHPEFGKKLFWFEDIRDHELEHCYRHAAGLITTSCAEGFNLPIVEALKHGCPVLASDLAVHREIGGAYAAFFAAGDAADLVRLVLQHQHQGMLKGVRSPADFQWPDWPESCRELLEQVIGLATDSPALSSERSQLTSVA